MDVAFLDRELTESLHDLEPPKSFAAELNARGSYHTEKFVLRLSEVMDRYHPPLRNYPCKPRAVRVFLPLTFARTPHTHSAMSVSFSYLDQGPHK